MKQSDTISRRDLAKRIATSATLKGTFLLRSGQTAHTYFDKYRFEGDPALLSPLAREMSLLLPTDTEILAGLELGGVPLATAISLHTGLPAAFIRKTPKTYGTCRAIEGQDIAGKKVTFIEDVITTGGAVADAYRMALAEEAQILSVICAIWRGEGEPAILGAPELQVRPVFSAEDLEV